MDKVKGFLEAVEAQRQYHEICKILGIDPYALRTYSDNVTAKWIDKDFVPGKGLRLSIEDVRFIPDDEYEAMINED